MDADLNPDFDAAAYERCLYRYRDLVSRLPKDDTFWHMENVNVRFAVERALGDEFGQRIKVMVLDDILAHQTDGMTPEQFLHFLDKRSHKGQPWQ